MKFRELGWAGGEGSGVCGSLGSVFSADVHVPGDLG